MFEYLLTHTSTLNVFMWSFTILELLVGLGITFGLFSRLAAIGITLLSLSMLLSAGWLGATCLDEWQIGCFGVGGGLMLAMTGVGWHSFDRLIGERAGWWTSKPMAWITSGRVMGVRAGRGVAVALAAFTVFVMLGTNQAFVGGLWGPLSNPSAKPAVKISNVSATGTTLNVTVYRVNGPDTYGAFVTELKGLDAHGTVVVDLTDSNLADAMRSATFHNKYVMLAKAGLDGLIVPAGRQGRHLHPVAPGREHHHRGLDAGRIGSVVVVRAAERLSLDPEVGRAWRMSRGDNAVAATYPAG